MKSLWLTYLSRAAVLFLGILFLIAGSLKMLNPSEAELGLAAIGFSRFFSFVTVFAVTVTEMAIGVCLLMGINVRGILKTAGSLILLFTCYLWYLSTLANPPACGCLGLSGIFDTNRQQAFFGMVRNMMILFVIYLALLHIEGSRFKLKMLRAE
jgi:hypothetical protein